LTISKRERSRRALRRAYDAGGVTQKELAERYGIMRGERRAAVGGPTSENNRNKLTAEDAREIRKRYAEGGVSYADLAERYPVTASGIWHVVTGAVFADAGWPIRGTTGDESH
jgi:hypothetical protein